MCVHYRSRHEGCVSTIVQGTRDVCPLSFKARGMCVHYRSRHEGCVSTIVQGTRDVCPLSFKARGMCVHYRSRHEECVSTIIQGVFTRLTNLGLDSLQTQQRDQHLKFLLIIVDGSVLAINSCVPKDQTKDEWSRNFLQII